MEDSGSPMKSNSMFTSVLAIAQQFTDRRFSRPAKMLIGEENAVLQQKVWENVLAALRKDVPEIDSLLAQ